MTRSFLSLHDATMRDPSQFHETLSGMSGKSISARTSHVPQFQINTLLSEPKTQDSQLNNRQHNSTLHIFLTFDLFLIYFGPIVVIKISQKCSSYFSHLTIHEIMDS